MADILKDSKVEWLGKIPEDWKVERIGTLYSLRNSKVSDEDYPPLSVTMQGILPQLETVAKTDDHSNRKLVKKGDFAINSRSDRRGSCGISDYDGSVSLINIVLKPNAKMNPVYYNWLFHTSLFADEFYKWGHGIVDDLWTTNWQDMKNIFVTIPPLDEQEKIANFLDEKCAEIDKLSEDIQKQIDILNDYKKSVITRAVTKGLDPNAEMKDSGIKWIGEIPKDWTCKKIKYLANTKQSNSFVDGDWIEAPFVKDNGIRYITTGNIGDGVFKRQGDGYVTEEDFKMLKCKYAYSGDLIFSRLNEEYGRSCILPNDYPKYVIAVDNVILRTEHDKRFICYCTQCPGYHDSVADYARGTAMKRISRINLGNISIPIPTLSEEVEIADYLDDKCSKINDSISAKQEQIAKLDTYKKSMIYEYVTGKKRMKGLL
jgi:type I restriction modification DNA specificity domain protein